MRDLKGRFIKGSKLGFKKGHPLYNNKLKEWRENGGVPWNKGKNYIHKIRPTKERCLRISEKLKGNHNARSWKHKVTEKHRESYRKRRLKQKFIKSNTKIELIVQNLLKEKGIDFEVQYPLINKYLGDIFIKPNIVIEIDGTYWHSLPKSILRDQEKDKNLIEAGYKIIHLQEELIKNNLSDCWGKITTILK